MTGADEGVAPAELSRAAAGDYDELFAAYAQIVDSGAGFPTSPADPGGVRRLLDRAFFVVWIARVGGRLVGAYYVKPNFVGRRRTSRMRATSSSSRTAAGTGPSWWSIRFTRARRLGFDAMQFNLVFASNPARQMYRQLGFQEVGRIPAAVDGEDAVVYWRSLEEEAGE